MIKKPDFVSIGVVTSVHGIKGEILVTPITDSPEQFFQLKKVYLKDRQGPRRIFDIESVRRKKNALIIKMVSVNTRDQAETLKGYRVEKAFDVQKSALKTDEFYIFELIGLNIKTTDGRWLGEITDVMQMPANDVYIVKNDDEEILIPAIGDVVKKVDLENGFIFIEPIKGLL